MPDVSGTLPTVSLFVAKSTLTEGADTALNAIVTRTPSELTSSVTVEFYIPVTTRNVAGADDFVGGLAPKVVTFAPGETSQAVSWGLVDDNVPEVPGAIGLWLRNPVNATVSTNGGGSAGVVIQDNDPTDTMSIAAVGASAVREGDASDQGTHKLTFDIVREGNTSWPVTAAIVIEADTSAGAHSASSSDIVGGFTTQWVYFNYGETHKTFEVTIAGDNLLEGNETFVVRISNTWSPSGAPGFLTGIGTAAVTATILDDDTPVVPGTAGNDVLHHVDGSHIYDGGAGFDVLDYGTTGRRGLAVTRSAEGDVVITHGGQTDTLRSVEEVRLADGRLVFNEADPAAQVVRLYHAALDRGPEQQGLNFWIERLGEGHGLLDLAQNFLASPEFNARYGSLTDSQYVDRLYQNVLGREGEAAGKAWWLSQLGSGHSRAEVLQGFSESAENRANTADLWRSGIWDVDEHALQAARLYDTVLGRLPDAPGLAFQASLLDSGVALRDVAAAFTHSPEFQAKYGALDDRQFVSNLYLNTLHRAAEPAGLDHWVARLQGGASRSDVVLGFSESPEHIALTNPDFMSDDPGHYGIAFA